MLNEGVTGGKGAGSGGWGSWEPSFCQGGADAKLGGWWLGSLWLLGRVRRRFGRDPLLWGAWLLVAPLALAGHTCCPPRRVALQP